MKLRGLLNQMGLELLRRFRGDQPLSWYVQTHSNTIGCANCMLLANQTHFLLVLVRYDRARACVYSARGGFFLFGWQLAPKRVSARLVREGGPFNATFLISLVNRVQSVSKAEREFRTPPSASSQMLPDAAAARRTCDQAEVSRCISITFTSFVI